MFRRYVVDVNFLLRAFTVGLLATQSLWFNSDDTTKNLSSVLLDSDKTIAESIKTKLIALDKNAVLTHGSNSNAFQPS